MDSVRLVGLLIVSGVSAVLALAVLLRDSRQRANRAFAATVAVSIAWLTLAFLSDQPRLQAQALALNRLTLAASLAMGVFLFYFALVYPRRVGGIGRSWTAFLAVGVGIAIATATSPLVVAAVVFRSYGTDVVPGMGFIAYSGWVLFGLAALIIVLTRKYRFASGRDKAQLKYLMLGLTLFAGLSVVFGLVLPALSGSYATAVLNTLTPLVLIGFVAYAMIRHRLMDMRIVVLRGVVYAILLVSFAVFFLQLAHLVRDHLFVASGMSADAAFMLAGLVSVFAFQPLRVWLENHTDKVFFRRQYDQETLLERLGDQLIGTADASEIAAAISAVLAEQLKAGAVALAQQRPGGMVVYGDGIAADDSGLYALFAHSPRGRPLLAEELESNADVAPVLSRTRIQVVCGIGIDDEVRALLLLGDKRSGEAYTEQDLRFVQMLLPEIAIALRTAELFEQRDQRVRELTALNQLAQVLGEDIQLDALLSRALAEVIKVVTADGGSIMLLDPVTQTLSVDAACGLSQRVVRDTRVALGERISGWVAEHRTSLLMLDDDVPLGSALRRDGVKSALSIPLVTHDHVIGVLNLSRSSSIVAFTQENMSIVSSFAGQLAVAIENAQLYNDLEGHVIGTITALAAAVEAKDPYTFGHSSEVTNVALAIAAEMRLDARETETLRKASLLHDIGKIGIDGAILNKPGPLDDDEFGAIKRHPEIAANILSSLEFLDEIVPLVLHHHERYDGRGYPAGIAGADIPLGARIICVADSYDAMTSDRTYRRGMPKAKALDELKRNAGTQFDADVVDAYLRSLAGPQQQVAAPPNALRAARFARARA